jgi:hypothetical protein
MLTLPVGKLTVGRIKVKNELRRLDAYSRRGFIEGLAKSCLGVSLLPLLPDTAFAAESTGRARHVIYLFMQGAMSHLDTFDPKTHPDIKGETKVISTSVSGISIADNLPKLARNMEHLAVIRGMTTATGAHEQGQYLMRTSYKQIASTRHPFLGSWLHKMDGKLNPDLPGSVTIGGANRHPRAGFMEALYAPAPVGNAKNGLENTKPPGYLSESQFDKRQRLINKFERGFRARYQHSEVKSYIDFYREATKLMKSQDLKAFDINQESPETKKAYGENGIGQGCLLARRLVEKRVRFVEVDFGGWDNHRDIFTTIPTKAAQLDTALTALINDLQSKGLLQETLIVLGTEFGRTPKINQNAGRDHHPGAFSCVLAGAGINGGQVWGASDEKGQSVEDGHTSPADLNATIASALGLPIDKEIYSPAGRPFKVAHDGTPIKELLS